MQTRSDQMASWLWRSQRERHDNFLKLFNIHHVSVVWVLSAVVMGCVWNASVRYWPSPLITLCVCGILFPKTVFQFLGRRKWISNNRHWRLMLAALEMACATGHAMMMYCYVAPCLLYFLVLLSLKYAGHCDLLKMLRTIIFTKEDKEWFDESVGCLKSEVRAMHLDNKPRWKISTYAAVQTSGIFLATVGGLLKRLSPIATIWKFFSEL